MNFVNLTPHEINIKKTDGSILTLPKSDTPARCKQTEEKLGSLYGVAIYESSFGDVENLPAPQDDTIFIVSRMIVEASGRKDLYSPGRLIRDDEGRPVGCNGISR